MSFSISSAVLGRPTLPLRRVDFLAAASLIQRRIVPGWTMVANSFNADPRFLANRTKRLFSRWVKLIRSGRGKSTFFYRQQILYSGVNWVFSAKSSRVVRAMLQEPLREWQLNELAAHPCVRVSPGLMSRIKASRAFWSPQLQSCLNPSSILARSTVRGRLTRVQISS